MYFHASRRKTILKNSVSEMFECCKRNLVSLTILQFFIVGGRDKAVRVLAEWILIRSHVVFLKLNEFPSQLPYIGVSSAFHGFWSPKQRFSVLTEPTLVHTFSKVLCEWGRRLFGKFFGAPNANVPRWLRYHLGDELSWAGKGKSLARCSKGIH